MLLTGELILNALKILKENFGYNQFRKGQEEIINAIAEGKSVSVIIPTGGGKSICYQVPSLMREGVGVIVSPLIALMEDQVRALKQNGINAVYINSTLANTEKRQIINDIENGKVDMLYVSPELMFSERFYRWLQKTKISLFAIDESHCLSQWGHNFRSDYIQLEKLKTDFPNIPRVALTATANEMSREEIRTILGIDKDLEFISGFDRPNISYNIQEKDIEREKEQLLSYINRNHKNETGICYCISKKRTEEIASYLRDNNKNAVHYHAGMSHKERKLILERFTNEQDIIVVATIAFGMGIDKPNVRFVCHMDLPTSIEAYYQETGRAGRDGEPSVAWMLYGIEDVMKREYLIEESGVEGMYKNIEKNNLNTMFTLCEINKCRRQVILNYFGQSADDHCGNCDNCLYPKPIGDATIQVQKALSTVARTKQKFGVNHLIDILLGNKTVKVKKHNHHELSVFGIGQDLKRENWKVLFRQLIVLGYLEIEPHYNCFWLTPRSLNVLKKGEKIFLSKSVTEQKVFFGRHTKDIKSLLTYEDKRLMAILKKKRMELAKKQRVPAYLVFNDATLTEIVMKKPKTISQFQNIDGIGYQKSLSFGEIIIEEIKKSL